MSDDVWCLICGQRPAEGVLQRVYVDDSKPVVIDSRPLPKVCMECAERHAKTPATSDSGRLTMWDFSG